MTSTDTRHTVHSLAVGAALSAALATAGLALAVIDGPYTLGEYVGRYGVVLVTNVLVGGTLSAWVYRTARGRAATSWLDDRSFWVVALVGGCAILGGLVVAQSVGLDGYGLEAALYGLLLGNAVVTAQVAVVRRERRRRGAELTG